MRKIFDDQHFYDQHFGWGVGTFLMRNIFDDQHFWWPTFSMRSLNIFDEDNFWWGAFLMRNIFDKQNFWWPTFLMRRSNIYDEAKQQGGNVIGIIKFCKSNNVIIFASLKNCHWWKKYQWSAWRASVPAYIHHCARKHGENSLPEQQGQKLIPNI